MARRTFSGLALIALVVATPSLAATDSAIGAPPVPTTIAPAPPMRAELPPAPVTPFPEAAPQSVDAMPAAYVRPGYGFQLPADWMTEQHFIADPRRYGFDAPAAGFGWSRYFDDAVLTDQWGRVYAARTAMDWPGRDRRYAKRNKKTDGVVGGVAGGAVGAVAGNLIAGTGSRLAGSLIGGGVGALIGMGIELLSKEDRARGYGDGYRGYGMHWTGAQSYGYAQSRPEEVITETRTIPGERVCVPRTTYVASRVRARPVARPGKIHRMLTPERVIKHTKRIGS